jgi:hypothetical protein
MSADSQISLLKTVAKTLTVLKSRILDFGESNVKTTDHNLFSECC